MIMPYELESYFKCSTAIKSCRFNLNIRLSMKSTV